MLALGRLVNIVTEGEVLDLYGDGNERELARVCGTLAPVEALRTIEGRPTDDLYDGDTGVYRAIEEVFPAS